MTEKIRNELLKRWSEFKPTTTPLVLREYYNGSEMFNVAIKDESQNVTNTYKAHHGWMMGVDYLKNHFPNPFLYYLTSTGNAATADFAFADKLNGLLGEELITTYAFYPDHYYKKMFVQDTGNRCVSGTDVRKAMRQFKSARVCLVDFEERYWQDRPEINVTPCLDYLRDQGARIHGENVKDITEGFNPTYSSIMGDFIEQIKKNWKHFRKAKDVKEFPRTLLTVQFGAGILYDDCKAIAEKSGLPIDVIAVSSGNPETIADKICDVGEIWQENLQDLRVKGITCARKSKDPIYHVHDDDIGMALHEFQKYDLEAEPSGAAGFAFLREGYPVRGQNYDLHAVINTGNGTKTVADFLERTENKSDTF